MTTTIERARGVAREAAVEERASAKDAPLPVGLTLFLALMVFFFALVAACFYVGSQIG